MNFYMPKTIFSKMTTKAQSESLMMEKNKSDHHRKLFEYVIKLGIRLKAQSETIASASIYCYKVLKNDFPSEICAYVSLSAFCASCSIAEQREERSATRESLEWDFTLQKEPKTMATSCFLLAGKITNDPKITVRDVMNISYSILHPAKPLLDIGELSYSLRESLVEMELVVLRYLRFKLHFEHPHKHLILMLAILRDWYPDTFESNPNIDKVAGMFLQDLYAEPRLIVEHRPKTLAVLVISMTFAALELGILDEDWIPTIQPKVSIQRIVKLKATALKEVYS